jgi:hypothetical protein
VSPFIGVALAGLAVVVACWLALAFLPPGRARQRLAAIGANGLFLALAGWFVHLALDARADGRTWLLIPFGFFGFVFCAGLLLSLRRTALELRGRAVDAASGATN